MAKPIQDTPVLKGKDAERFIERMMHCEERKETPEQKAKRIAAYEATMRMFVK